MWEVKFCLFLFAFILQLQKGYPFMEVEVKRNEETLPETASILFNLLSRAEYVTKYANKLHEQNSAIKKSVDSFKKMESEVKASIKRGNSEMNKFNTSWIPTRNSLVGIVRSAPFLGTEIEDLEGRINGSMTMVKDFLYSLHKNTTELENITLDSVSGIEDNWEIGITEGEKSTSCPCGWVYKVEESIQEERELTKLKKFPFLAQVVTDIGVNLCTGVIITERLVLTSAHCIQGYSTYQLRVKVGEANFGQGHVFEVFDKHKHEHYGTERDGNDISILSLKKRIPWSNAVGPVCVPETPFTISKDNQYINAIGWDKALSQFTLKTSQILPISECIEKLGGLAGQSCSWEESEQNCQEDNSEGLLVRADPETNRYTLVGIESFVENCVMVYTNIYRYIFWIQEKIRIFESTIFDSNVKGELCHKL